MDFKNVKIDIRLHYPECNSLYTIIDNAFSFCLGCELSNRSNGSILHEGEYQKK